MPHSFCPICLAPAKFRERWPGGNDTCKQGHVYPSAKALSEPFKGGQKKKREPRKGKK